MNEAVRLSFETLLPVFVVLTLGYYAGWRRRLDRVQISGLNVFLMHFVLPCSLFLGVARTPPAVLRQDWPLPAALAVVMAITFGLTFWIVRKTPAFGADRISVQALTVSFANNVAIGLPLLLGVFGPRGIVPVAAAIVSGSLVVTPMTLVLLEYQQEKGEVEPTRRHTTFGAALRASVRRPIVWAPVLAIFLPVFGWTLPASVVAPLDLLGKATIGVALFVTGILIAYSPIALSRTTVSGVFLKNVLQPVLLLAVLLPFGIHGELLREAFLLAAVPAGFFGTIFGVSYGVSSVETSSTLVYSTAASVVTLPMALILARHLPQ